MYPLYIQNQSTDWRLVYIILQSGSPVFHPHPHFASPHFPCQFSKFSWPPGMSSWFVPFVLRVCGVGKVALKKRQPSTATFKLNFHPHIHINWNTHTCLTKRALSVWVEVEQLHLTLLQLGANFSGVTMRMRGAG